MDNIDEFREELRHIVDMQTRLKQIDVDIFNAFWSRENTNMTVGEFKLKYSKLFEERDSIIRWLNSDGGNNEHN